MSKCDFETAAYSIDQKTPLARPDVHEAGVPRLTDRKNCGMCPWLPHPLQAKAETRDTQVQCEAFSFVQVAVQTVALQAESPPETEKKTTAKKIEQEKMIVLELPWLLSPVVALVALLFLN